MQSVDVERVRDLTERWYGKENDADCSDAAYYYRALRWALTHGRPPVVLSNHNDPPGEPCKACAKEQALCKTWNELRAAVGVQG